MTKNKAILLFIACFLVAFFMINCDLLPKDKPPEKKSVSKPHFSQVSTQTATQEVHLATPETVLVQPGNDNEVPVDDNSPIDPPATPEAALSDETDPDGNKLSDIDTEFTTEEEDLIGDEGVQFPSNVLFPPDDNKLPEKKPTIFYLTIPKAVMLKEPDPSKGGDVKVRTGEVLVLVEEGEIYYKMKKLDGRMGYIEKDFLTYLPLHLTMLRSGIVKTYSPDGLKEVYNPTMQILILNPGNKPIENLGLKADYFYEGQQLGTDFIYVASYEHGYNHIESGGTKKIFSRVSHEIDSKKEISEEHPITVRVYYTTFKTRGFTKINEFKITHKEY